MRKGKKENLEKLQYYFKLSVATVLEKKKKEECLYIEKSKNKNSERAQQVQIPQTKEPKLHISSSLNFIHSI